MSFFQKINKAKFTGDWLIEGDTYSMKEDVKPVLDAGPFSLTKLFNLYKENQGKIETEEEFIRRFVALIDAAIPEEDGEASTYYGYIQQDGLYRVADVTADMLTSSATITKEPLAAATHKIDLPEGCLLIVAIAAGKGFNVLQDDGVGGKCAFNENIGLEGTGANGIPITIKGKEYLIYGELVLIDCTATIYVGN